MFMEYCVFKQIIEDQNKNYLPLLYSELEDFPKVKKNTGEYTVFLNHSGFFMLIFPWIGETSLK